MIRHVFVISLLAVLSQFTFTRFDPHKLQFCRLMTALFHLCLLICLALAITAIRGSTLGDLTKMSGRRLSITPSEYRYPLCDMRFPLGLQNGPNSLSILDFAKFSALANYEKGWFDKAFQDLFPGWKKIYEHRGPHMARHTERYRDWTTFFELVDPSNTTTVITIRGTKDTLDWLQDALIWMPVVISQIASIFGPNLTPLIKDAMFWFSKNFFHNDAGLIDRLLEHVRKTVRENPKRRYYLTGHSLGGGLANIVSLEVKQTSIAFSPPGVSKTARWILNTDYNFQGIAPKLSYSIVAEGDLVPYVDRQLGTMYHVSCPTGNPMKCHNLATIIDEIKDNCQL